MHRGDDTSTTRDEDEGYEAAVLRRLIELHPVSLTVTEVARELVGEDATFAERDAVERAVSELAAAGLLHLRDEFAIPTRPALRFSELLDR